MAGHGRQRHVVARHEATGLQQLVALLHVLACRAHVGATRQCPLEEQPSPALAGDLDLRDGVEAVIDDLTGVDAQVGPRRQHAVAGGGGDHRVAVHGRTAVGWVGRAGHERLGKHAPARSLERHAFGRQRCRPARAGERCEPGVEGHGGLRTVKEPVGGGEGGGPL